MRGQRAGLGQGTRARAAAGAALRRPLAATRGRAGRRLRVRPQGQRRRRRDRRGAAGLRRAQPGARRARRGSARCWTPAACGARSPTPHTTSQAACSTRATRSSSPGSPPRRSSAPPSPAARSSATGVVVGADRARRRRPRDRRRDEQQAGSMPTWSSSPPASGPGTAQGLRPDRPGHPRARARSSCSSARGCAFRRKLSQGRLRRRRRGGVVGLDGGDIAASESLRRKRTGERFEHDDPALARGGSGTVGPQPLSRCRGANASRRRRPCRRAGESGGPVSTAVAQPSAPRTIHSDEDDAWRSGTRRGGGADERRGGEPGLKLRVSGWSTPPGRSCAA